MERKEFFKRLGGMALLTLPAAYVVSCSGSDDSDGGNNNNNNAPNCLENGARAGTIVNNHGHSLIVPRADVEAGVEKTYNIQGTSSHSHLITVTAANFQTLSNNQQVVVGSTNDNNHTHSVTLICA